MSSSIRDRRSSRHSPSSLTIGGFLPMPPISASPVCTPTSTMPNGDFLPPSTTTEFSEADVDHRVLPTWISIPPTPTAKNVRRSVTCVVRRPPSPLSPSASFPAPASPSSNSLSCRPRAHSDSSATRPALTRSEVGILIPRVSSPESDLGSEAEDAWDLEKGKDDVRKYHALMELLTTEASYLEDLRALFLIYLRNLHTLCRTPSITFGRGSSSRNNSYTHLPKTSVLSDHRLHPLTTLHAKPKPSARPLFTDAEIGLLTRNAEEVLHLHENFVEELRAAILPLGFPMEPLEVQADGVEQQERIRNIDAVVGEVSTKFATEASRFDAYQSFCTGHPQALQLVHRVQHQFPLEWEAYEQHCASLIANMGEDSLESRSASLGSCSDSEERSTSEIRKRTASLTSLDGALRKDGFFHGRRDKHSRRLAFLDYMIKPIQRICKYPLLLDQLRPSKTLRAMSHPAARSHVTVVVESAAQAMRHVASAVDDARHRQDVKMQSSLIISRMVLANPATATSHMSHLSSAHPAFQILTASFLSSLGICLLAGSLDVMHYQASKPSGGAANINAKYLGAFLYLGGYLILVKVSKGKVYEPKHWFSLAEFNVVDLEEEDTSLPCTFSLIGKDHQFDFTAACQREKEAWLSSIQESRLHPPAWINEPTSSIHSDGKGELVPSTLDGPFEIIPALPTIQSLPELATEDGSPQLTEAVLAAFRGEVGQHQVLKPETPTKAQPTHSRRSSSTSMKAIFGPSSADIDTIVIRRSSPTARMQVDQGLQDVISEPVLAARSHASRREELFQAPKILRTSGSFARSTSALSLTGLTKTRLSRHESVRVPRRKSATDDGIIMATESSSFRHKQRPKRLTIVSTAEADSIFQSPSDVSPSPFSQCSSSSNPASPTVAESSPLPIVPPRQGSLMSRLSSGAATPSPAPSPRSNPPEYRTITQGLLKRWSKGTRHRRTRSAPHDQNVPEEEDTKSRSQSPVLPELEFGVALSLSVSPQSLPEGTLRPSVAAPELSRRLRLLSSGSPITFRYSSADNTEPRTSKRGSIFKRLKGSDRSAI
ncbi:hypothetical protein B0H16DRAFT_606759 [Mycena metata]|uniref:DH domain-containing protein n=1 Tax=Mycena metata TaxID=1033252 RepID=A0AAD7K9M4_9AGAR|nr:hypothetical protein B0H16DRAFT_606759 [Mycena metata]